MAEPIVHEGRLRRRLVDGPVNQVPLVLQHDEGTNSIDQLLSAYETRRVRITIELLPDDAEQQGSPGERHTLDSGRWRRGDS